MFAKLGDLWYLRGIISASFFTTNNTCDVSNYALFTNAQMFSDWVKQVVRQATSGYTEPQPKHPPKSEWTSANIVCTYMTLEFEPDRILKGVEAVKPR